MATVFAKSGDPDQMPHYAVSDLGLHCLPLALLGSRLKNRLISLITKMSLQFLCLYYNETAMRENILT